MKYKQLAYLTKTQCVKYLRSYQLKAYNAILTAFVAGGELTEVHEDIIEKIRGLMKISQERHEAEVRRVLSDKLLTTVTLRNNGRPFESRLLMERGRNNFIFHRNAQDTKHTRIADLAISQCNDSVDSYSVSVKDFLDENEHLSKNGPENPNSCRQHYKEASRFFESKQRQPIMVSVETSTADLADTLMQFIPATRSVGLTDPLVENLGPNESYVYLADGTTLKMKETKMADTNSGKNKRNSRDGEGKAQRKKRKTAASQANKESNLVITEVIKSEKAIAARKKILQKGGEFSSLKEVREQNQQKQLQRNILQQKQLQKEQQMNYDLPTRSLKPDVFMLNKTTVVQSNTAPSYNHHHNHNLLQHHHQSTTATTHHTNEKLHDSIMSKIPPNYQPCAIEKAQNMLPQTPVPPEHLYAAGVNRTSNLYHSGSTTSSSTQWMTKQTLARQSVANSAATNEHQQMHNNNSNNLKRKQEQTMSEPPNKISSSQQQQKQAISNSMMSQHHSQHHTYALKRAEIATTADGATHKTINSKWTDMTSTPASSYDVLSSAGQHQKNKLFSSTDSAPTAAGATHTNFGIPQQMINNYTQHHAQQIWKTTTAVTTPYNMQQQQRNNNNDTSNIQVYNNYNNVHQLLETPAHQQQPLRNHQPPAANSRPLTIATQRPTTLSTPYDDNLQRRNVETGPQPIKTYDLTQASDAASSLIQLASSNPLVMSQQQHNNDVTITGVKKTLPAVTAVASPTIVTMPTMISNNYQSQQQRASEQPSPQQQQITNCSSNNSTSIQVVSSSGGSDVITPCYVTTTSQPGGVIKVTKPQLSSKGPTSITHLSLNSASVKTSSTGQKQPQVFLLRAPGGKASVQAKFVELGSGIKTLGGGTNKITQIKTLQRNLDIGIMKPNTTAKSLSGKLVSVSTPLRVPKNVMQSGTVTKMISTSKNRVPVSVVVQKSPSVTVVSNNNVTPGGRKMISVCQPVVTPTSQQQTNQNEHNSNRPQLQQQTTTNTSSYKYMASTYAAKPVDRKNDHGQQPMQPLTPIAVLNSMSKSSLGGHHGVGREVGHGSGVFPTSARARVVSAANVAHQQQQMTMTSANKTSSSLSSSTMHHHHQQQQHDNSGSSDVIITTEVPPVATFVKE